MYDALNTDYLLKNVYLPRFFLRFKSFYFYIAHQKIKCNNVTCYSIIIIMLIPSYSLKNNQWLINNFKHNLTLCIHKHVLS